MPVDPNKVEDVAVYMPPPKVRKPPYFPPRNLRLSDADYFAMFKSLDLDRVGSFSMNQGDLSHEEIGEVLKRFGLVEENREKFFEMAMLDEDGCLDFAEFKRIMHECLSEIRLYPSEQVYITWEVVVGLLISCRGLLTTIIVALPGPQFFIRRVYHFLHHTLDDHRFDHHICHRKSPFSA